MNTGHVSVILIYRKRIFEHFFWATLYDTGHTVPWVQRGAIRKKNIKRRYCQKTTLRRHFSNIALRAINYEVVKLKFSNSTSKSIYTLVSKISRWYWFWVPLSNFIRNSSGTQLSSLSSVHVLRKYKNKITPLNSKKYYFHLIHIAKTIKPALTVKLIPFLRPLYFLGQP